MRSPAVARGLQAADLDAWTGRGLHGRERSRACGAGWVGRRQNVNDRLTVPQPPRVEPEGPVSADGGTR
ncbi:MAG: hypothetical protein ACLP4R_31180, partial [Solirubrobacteraceae bacterium]